ncbi:sugar phosphate isomerase/epimerase [Blastopirellula sp. JC732]|uniref:Sugar phosphate isomerase/epimerase n=1 Tax=Blastopirellula sediminis TaxID=2894196 RepID=A0A9X1MU27_9BACT|nr:TIM barrel protein [Blastopirellula sediminis]MCC9605106.1 sugar phosphate isomerase/epimerase [Blastopirellula sediminis]MCC9631594.1 sugar phosphate isomerase/epimerase [Blastopirellula sediminis]
MNELPQVLLSGFADEAANDKLAVQQFSAFAALGLEYYSLRFIDVGNGIKNVMALNKSEIAKIRHMEGEYGLNVASIGSPIGKVKLIDSNDGSKNRFVKFDKYLSTEVQKACELAHAFETKLIRGFSFYHPIGSDPQDHISQAVDQLGQIAEACHRSDLTFGLEVEANLIGQNGDILAQIHKQVNHPAMMLIFDAGNLVCQGYTPDEVYQQYVAMKPGLGWMHIKDYKVTKPITEKGHIDEDALKNFVPANLGDSGHERILRDFATMIPKLEKKLKKRGIPGVFLDLEPHVKGGGQFGGFSGPDGMGVALRGLCKTLDFAGVGYHLRDFDDICAARGF